jgi:hypothetical protein
MKKIVIVFALAALLVLTVGSIAYAQVETPIFPGGRGPGGMGGGRGPGRVGPGDGSGLMHEAMVESLAEVLGITVDEFEARREAGETMYEIAESLGLDFEALREAIDQARIQVMEQAYADGTITQEQYEMFLNRGEGSGQRGGGRGLRGGGGFGGNCPFPDTDN